MIWSGFAIALFLVYIVQMGIASLLGWTEVDFFLALALVCGLMAPTYEARLAAWITGLAQDLGSADPLGIHAFILGLTGLLVTQLREIGNVRVWWVRWLIAFLAAWPGQMLYHLYQRFWAGFGDETIFTMAVSAAATSALAAGMMLLITFLPSYHGRRRHSYGGA